MSWLQIHVSLHVVFRYLFRREPKLDTLVVDLVYNHLIYVYN